MRVLIGDRFGRILTEMEPQVDPMSVLLNEIGKTKLRFSSSDSKATETNLQFGNTVYIEPDNGIPPWGGILDLPRTWAAGVINVPCYTIGYVLQSRLTGKNDLYYEEQVGGVFQKSLERIQQQDPLGLVFGNIWNGGRAHYPRYNYKTLWYVLNFSLRNMETCDFKFTPYLDEGVIRFKAELFQVAGSNKSSSVTLYEGMNTEASAEIEEQGQLVNTHYAVGEGSAWDDTRPVVIGTSPESIARYGLRESREIYTAVTLPATLEMHARHVLKHQAEPQRLFRLKVTNDVPGLFSSYDVGDVVQCILPSYTFGGFDKPVRVIGREYDPNSGICGLIVEQPQEIDYWIKENELEPEE